MEENTVTVTMTDDFGIRYDGKNYEFKKGEVKKFTRPMYNWLNVRRGQFMVEGEPKKEVKKTEKKTSKK